MNKIIIILTAMGFIILFIACSLTFCGKIGIQEPQNIQMPQIQLILSPPNDSVNTYLSGKQIQEFKSYIDSIYSVQNSHYENALNDLRQESNNIINKWNAWFSFWMALLAILAGIIPMLMQIKVANDNEKRINEEISNLREGKNNLQEGIDKKLKEYSECINYRVDMWQKQVNELPDKINLGYKQFRMADIMNTFSIGWDNKLFTDCKERTRLLNSILAHLKTLFDEYVTDLRKEKRDEEQLLYVMELLIMLHGILKKLLPTYTKNYKSKKVIALIDSIEQLIIAIAQKDKVFDEKFKQELNDISNRFNSLIDAEAM